MSNTNAQPRRRTTSQTGSSPADVAAKRLETRRKTRARVKAKASSSAPPSNDETGPLTPEQSRARGGRPCKDPWNKRDRLLRTRVSGPEYAIIEEKAAKAGMSFSQYLREMGLKGRVTLRKTITQKSTQDRDLVLQGIRAGGLLNQVAKKLNSGRGYIPRDLAAAIKANQQWMKAVKKFDDEAL